MAYADLPASEFAFPGPLRDALVAAILSGSKTSTTSLALSYEVDGDPLPAAGERSVLIGSAGEPLAVLEVTGVRLLPLADIDLAHAVDEGEGHESVAEWRAGHEKFWHSDEMRGYLGQPDFTVTDDTIAVAERFRVVSLIPDAERVQAALAAEAAALTKASRAAPEADLDRPTCCPPWTVKDEFAHTAIALSRTLAMLDAPEPRARPVSPARYYAPDARFSAEANAERIRSAQEFAAARTAGELIDWFERTWRAVAARVAATPGDRLVTTRHGDPMRLTDFQLTRVVELAVHGIDLADGLGVPAWLTDEAADVVEGLLLGLVAGQARRALGVDRAGLLRRITGRAPLTGAQRAALDRLGITWLTLGSPS